MAVLLAHWLKWQYQPERRGASWDLALREQRRQVVRKLNETSSLKPLLADPEWIAGVWGDALTDAARDTALAVFPETCPWPLTDVLQEDRRPA